MTSKLAGDLAAADPSVAAAKDGDYLLLPLLQDRALSCRASRLDRCFSSARIEHIDGSNDSGEAVWRQCSQYML